MSENILSVAEIQVLNYMGYKNHTYQAGSFIQALLGAFTYADIFNTMKLASVFPEIGAAIHSYNHGDLMERYGEHCKSFEPLTLRQAQGTETNDDN